MKTAKSLTFRLPSRRRTNQSRGRFIFVPIVAIARQSGVLLKRYASWRWRKPVNIGLLVFSVITISLVTYSAFAATVTATLVPNGDTTATGWTANPSGSLYPTVDEGTTDSTSDYITTTGSTADNETAQFALTTASAVQSAEQVTVRIYVKDNSINGGAADSLIFGLIVNGSPLTAGSCTASASWAACTTTYSGSWTQADVDSMEIKVQRSVQGSGSPSARADDIQVSNVYATLIYTPAMQFSQSAYRWFSNQDLSGTQTFAKAYGGTGSEFVGDMAKTSDGGVVLTGGTDSFTSGGTDVFLAKYSSSGTLSWAKRWGGGGTDSGASVIQTADGGYAITGRSTSFNDTTSGDMILLKYDSAGNLTWSKSLGVSMSDDNGVSVIEVTGGYIVVGNTQSYGAGGEDVFVAKYDTNGTLSWMKTWGGAGNELPTAATATAGGGVTVTGQTYSYGDSANGDMFITNFNSDGSLAWSKTWGGSDSDRGWGITQASDGSLLVTGRTYSYFDTLAGDMFIAKYGSDGTFSWSKIWGDYGGSNDMGQSVTVDTNGNYIVTGITDAFGAGGGDAIIVKYGQTGSLLSSKTWGGTSADEGDFIVSTSDGGYLIAGKTSSYSTGSSDVLLMRYDSAGSITGCTSPMCQTVTPHTGDITSSTTQTTASVAVSSPATATPSGTSGTAGFITKTILSPPSIDVASPLATQDTAVTAPAEGTILRLRLDIHVSGAQADAGTTSFKLQFADRGAAASCSAVSSASFGDVSDSSTGIRWADNSQASSGSSLTANANDPVHGSDPNILQTYQEKGTTTISNSAAIPNGDDGMWDFALMTYRAYANHHYCLRVVNSPGSVIDSYGQYPELTIPAATVSQAGYRLFENQDVTASPGSWTEATSAAAWAGRYGYGTLDYGGKMWLMGGYNGSFLGDVWSSTDGTNWTQVTASAPWGGNVDPGVVVFNNKMWLMGGYTPAASGDTSDVWYSTDGANWTKATTAPWPIREHCVTLVFNNKLWVIGGSSNGTYLHDAWYSSDGINWTEATANAPWSARYRPSGVAFNGKMYIMGGTTNNTSTFLNDVWSSTDGVNWTQETSAAPWPGRAFFTSVVYAGKIWVTGGYDATLNYNDLWYSSDGVNWTQEANAPWIPRQGITALAYNEQMWILGGYSPTGGNLNDVWSFYVPANIDVGAPLAPMQKPVELTSAEIGQPFRLRILLAVDNFGVAISDLNLKLQYARMQGSSCSATPSGSFSDVTSTSTLYFYDNTNANSAIQAVANANDPTDGSRPIDYQVYSEVNPFANSKSAIYSGEDGLWDFPLAVQAGTGHTSFCLRVINNDGSLLSNYSALPQIGLVPTMQQLMRGGEWFSQSDYGNNISL